MKESSLREDHVGRLRDRLRAETERTIVAAAEKTFAEQGVAGARMEAIAAEAGIAVGTLYNYFDDRDAILRAVFAHRRGELVGEVSKALHAVEREPFARQVEAFVRAAVSYIDAHLPFFSLLTQAESTSVHAARAEGIRETMQAWGKLAERVIARGVRDHAIRPELAMVHRYALLGMVRGVAFGKIRGDIDDLARAADALVRLFLHGAEASRGRHR